MTVHYVVYIATFTTQRGTARRYVGLTKVPSGATTGVALANRQRWHVRRPVAYLKPMVAGSLTLASVGRPVDLEDGLADEAILAAKEISARPRTVRGGPWSLPGEHGVLPTAHWKQIQAVVDAVANATSVADARRRVQALPGAALRAHLAGRNFVDQTVQVVARRQQRSGYFNAMKYESSARSLARWVASPKGKASQATRNLRYRG